MTRPPLIARRRGHNLYPVLHPKCQCDNSRMRPFNVGKKGRLRNFHPSASCKLQTFVCVAEAGARGPSGSNLSQEPPDVSARPYLNGHEPFLLSVSCVCFERGTGSGERWNEGVGTSRIVRERETERERERGPQTENS